MINIKELSTIFDVRPLEHTDTEAYYRLCKGNPDYYQHLQKNLVPNSLEKELLRLPAGKQSEDKHYLGFFKGNQLAAILDLIDGYPDKSTAFIGFFMLSTDFQGQGMGSRVIGDVTKGLKTMGYKKVRLGIAATNKNAKAFWTRNGFSAVSDAIVQNGVAVIPAEKVL